MPDMRWPCLLMVIFSAGLLPYSSACPEYCNCNTLAKDEYSVFCSGPNIATIPKDIPKNTTQLDISHAPITMLRKGDFVDLPNLKQLNVWWNLNLTVVELGTFDNLPTITSLGLFNNSFTKLPTGLLDSLKNLTTFDAHNSKLEMIQHGLFTDHPSIQEINLIFNNIAELETGSIGGLPELTKVNLQANRLTSLNPSVFKGSPKIKFLDISDNAITSIQKDAFTDSYVETLFLRNNAISAVDAAAFSPLKNLQSIYLDNNDIKSLDGAFKNLPYLQYVSLNNNQLTSLEGVFQNLPRLYSLSLSDNHVCKISNTTFVETVTGIASLTMTSNNIAEIESGAFKNFEMLSELYLNYNQIPEISLAGLNHLTSLTLDSNNLQSFPSNLQDAKKLEIISMNSNPIAAPLTDQFSALHSLKSLHLGNITSSEGMLNPKALCGSNALNDVWLFHNGLSALPPTTFECTPVIGTIWLQNNSLTELSPRLFHGLTELWWLDLSFNQLSYLDPDTFLGLDKLMTLGLPGNNFTNLAHVAPALASLPAKLYQLADNPFVYLGRDSFPTPMKYVETIYMSSSRVRVIEEGTFSDETFPNLTRLEIDQDESLHSLPADMLEDLHNLKTFIAQGDPFHCDCQLKGFVTWLRQQVKPPFVSATCASPPSLEGKNLNDVPLASLKCDCQREQAPSIDTSGSDTSVHIGKTAMLNCKISACPEAEFFWTTPTGAMLAVESGFPRMEVLASGTLVVTDGREEDTGVYTCTAVNYRGKASKEVALHVGPE